MCGKLSDHRAWLSLSHCGGAIFGTVPVLSAMLAGGLLHTFPVLVTALPRCLPIRYPGALQSATPAPSLGLRRCSSLHSSGVLQYPLPVLSNPLCQRFPPCYAGPMQRCAQFFVESKHRQDGRAGEADWRAPV